MPDEASASAIAPEQTRAVQEDGRLTWTVTEAAQLLGISRASAYEAAHRGELPVRVIGRRMLIPRVALLRLLASGRSRPHPPGGSSRLASPTYA
jgi:excisionase family DNA binding protein